MAPVLVQLTIDFQQASQLLGVECSFRLIFVPEKVEIRQLARFEQKKIQIKQGKGDILSSFIVNHVV